MKTSDLETFLAHWSIGLHISHLEVEAKKLPKYAVPIGITIKKLNYT
jgi:hypothetical protein